MQPEKPQSNSDREKLRESVFAKEKTYGEKKYDFIFGNLLNFWVNLLASAGFAFYVKHSVKPIFNVKMDGKTFTNFRELQRGFVDKIHHRGGMDMGKAESVVTMLTLLTPGHFVVIPSVWLGEKYKATIVKHFDRKHYGNTAMNSSELMRRHAEIAAAEKPSFIGTVVARVETALINSSIAYLIGAPNNLIKKIGEKTNIDSLRGFKGVDHATDKIGIAVGEGFKEGAPEVYKKWNKELSSPGFDFSEEQLRGPTEGSKEYTTEVVGKPYQKGLNNLMRYLTQDIMYTIISAKVVHPAVNFTKRFLPGMTYTPKVTAAALIAPAVTAPAKTTKIDVTEVATPAAATPPDETPAPKHEHAKAAHHHSHAAPTAHVHHAKTESTIHPRHEHAAHAGV
jgi:hypothetical protein